MKFLYLPILLLLVGNLSAQNYKQFKKQQDKNWAQGTVYLANGKSMKADVQLLISFTEGTLQVRKGDQVESLSPRVVTRFVYFDSLFHRIREFRSVPSKFRDRPGSKNIFLELIYEGEEYSLMSRFLPVAKTKLAIFPLPDWYIGYAIWTEGQLEQTLFVHKKEQYAHQITKRVKYLDDRFETRDPSKVDFKLDSFILKELFTPAHLKSMKKFCAQNKLDFNKQTGFTEALKYINGSAFAYNRSDRPKQLRN
jgi:hypothetical protein